MSENYDVRGVVTADPVANTRTLQLRISAVSFGLEDMASANHGVTLMASFKGTLLSVSFRNDRDHHTLGSAVLVHPGIAITAKHVVSDWLSDIAAGHAGAVCQAPTEKQLLLWDVVSIYSLDSGDIALLMLRYRADLPTENNFYVNRLTTRMPAVGDRVFLAGFTTETGLVDISPEISLRGEMRIGVGKVIDVWPSGRDRVMLPSAAFAVDCPAFGGMSGGPVFDKGGEIIGLVSSSSEGDEIAYVSHIWPALVGPIEPFWPLKLGGTTLLHMGRRHGIDIQAPDAFKPVIRDGSFGIEYVPWS